MTTSFNTQSRRRLQHSSLPPKRPLLQHRLGTCTCDFSLRIPQINSPYHILITMPISAGFASGISDYESLEYIPEMRDSSFLRRSAVASVKLLLLCTASVMVNTELRANKRAPLLAIIYSEVTVL